MSHQTKNIARLSHQTKNIARLHARDLVFYSKYLQRQLTSRTRQKPIIICNSYPKSGTHLLYQILYSIPGLTKWNDIVSVQALCGMMNTASHIRWKIGSAPDGSIVRSHLMYCQEIREILQEQKAKVFFIYRDLRDVAVSHARWVVKEKKIFLHPIYQQLDNFDDQLMSSIKGVPIGSPFSSNLSQPDIGQDFSRWQGWVDDKQTLAIKFEDLVGERGGSSEQKRLDTIAQILDILEVNLSTEEIKSKFASHVMNPQESHTFVKGGQGKKGGWKTYFKSEHKSAFKKVAGDTLIRLGYATDLNW